MPRELGQFDVVSVFEILYHIVDDRKYSQAFRNASALVPTGVLSLTWSVIERVASKHDRPYLGHWLGAAPYPVEISSLRWMSRPAPPPRL